MEKKVTDIQWNKAYRNYKEGKFLNPKEREFHFRFVHDLIHLGARNHFRGADQTCRRYDLGLKCTSLETRRHFFMECPPIHDVFCVFREVLQKFMKKKIYIDQIFTISFRCKDPIRNVIGVWFMIKVFCLVFQDDSKEITSILDKIVNTIDWIIGFCGGKYLEIFYELRTEIEIQKMAYLFDF